MHSKNQMISAAGKLQEMSHERQPMFFKFMLPEVPGKLSIPRAFLKNLIRKRCEKVTLRSTLGSSWHVKVNVTKEGIWFQDGWLDFAKEHDLQVGECLVFRYEGDMAFFVTIFDTSACEKKLSLVKDNKTLGKRWRTQDEKRPSPVVKKDTDDGEHQVIGVRNVHKSSYGAGIERLTSYTAKNPHFVATIIWSNLHNHYDYMNIPAGFRKENDLSSIHEMTLRDPKGRSWPVKVCRRIRGNAFFSDGWTALCKSNGLQLGDKCIFELNTASMTTMDVHIIKRPAAPTRPTKMRKGL